MMKSPSTLGNTKSRSCKYLRADLEKLQSEWLGNIIPPLGGQVKRAAMEEVSAEGSPTFSRLSGIQEWLNAVCLFVNVYGEGYKNVFLHNGQQITWFAQPRQWEGSPVVQRLINSSGGTIGPDDEGNYHGTANTRASLCRNLGQGYTYCGRLLYRGHEPTRLPVHYLGAA